MAKDNDDDKKPAKAETKVLHLDRTYIHTGRVYGPGEVTIGPGGPAAGEIDEEAFADLTKAVARAAKRDADVEAAKQEIDDRADAAQPVHPKKK